MARGFLLATLVFLLCAGLVPPPAHAADARVEDRGLPAPIVGASTVLMPETNLVYVLGGRLADGSYTNGILRYDPASGQNATVAHFPDVSIAPGSSERYSGVAATHNGKIYYFGGATVVQTTLGGQPARVPRSVPDIVVYDTNRAPSASNPYVLSSQAGKQTQSIPNGAWGMSLVTIGSTAYLFGGFTFDLSTTTFIHRDWILAFDMEKETLTQLSSTLPYPVQDAGIAYVTQPTPRVYLFGGLANNNTANECPGRYITNDTTGQQEFRQQSLCLTDEIVRWDPVIQDPASVVTTAKLPYRVQFVDAGSVRGGKAYLLGGLLVDGSASQAILQFDPSAGTAAAVRTLAPRLPTGLFGSGVTSDGTTLSLWGGRTGETNQLTNAITRFDPNPTAPYPPVGAVASRAGGGIHLTWQPPTYDGDSPITGYRIFRANADGTESLLTTTPVTGLSYDDASTRPGINYTYRLTARNSIGESAGVRISTATSTTPPGPVARVSGDTGERKAIISWTPPSETGGLDITGYHVRVNGTDRPVSLAASQLSYVWPDLADGVDYSFTVAAVNAMGEGAQSPAVHVVPAPVPDAPSYLNAVPTGGSASSATEVALSWAAPSGAVDHYVVLRATSATSDKTVLGTVPASLTSYTDPSVEHGKTYYYAVVSVNNAGSSAPANAAPVSLVRNPGAPTNLRALGLEGLVQLAWDAPTDLGDAEPNAITYVVMRTAVGSTRSSIISPPELKDTGFGDRTASPGIAYSYTVTAQNPRRGDPSLPATATAKDVPNKLPVASLNMLPSIAAAGDPVTLDASQSLDPDGTILSYAYDFGDGTDVMRSTNATMTHAYATNGSYTAKVVVTDDRGNLSAPATAKVLIGELIGNGGDTGAGSVLTPPAATAPTARPGSESPGKPLPGPALPVVAFALVAAALAARRHSRR